VSWQRSPDPSIPEKRTNWCMQVLSMSKAENELKHQENIIPHTCVFYPPPKKNPKTNKQTNNTTNKNTMRHSSFFQSYKMTNINLFYLFLSPQKRENKITHISVIPIPRKTSKIKMLIEKEQIMHKTFK